MTEINTMPADEQITDRDRPIIIGHKEAKRRLLDSPRWTEDDVDQLLSAVEGYEDFARCVVDELRWDQRDEEGDNGD
jgi:hypothetical protein